MRTAQRSSAGVPEGSVRVAGIDGCKGGWVGVVLARDDVVVVAGRTIASVVRDAGPVGVVGVDIPIGLPRGAVRAADRAAQTFLGARRSTVFSTPIRDALEAPTLAEAIAVSRDRTGAGISAQAYALRARILEVAAWLDGAGLDVREVHPEVSFSVMVGRPMSSPKKSWNGTQERVAALEAAGIRLPADLGRAGATAGVDDILDAAAAAWSARRIARGDARCFPDPPEDVAGRAVAIWA
jgi:predicted RNase H-like nuclease